MFSIKKPSYEELRQFLLRHESEPFTYDEVEGTRGAAPAGYSIGRRRIRLGHGREVYIQSKDNLRNWKMFPPEFVDLIWPSSIEVGRVVATLFQAPGFWTLNPCRIVYTINEADPESESPGERVERFGFAYGTIGKHLAMGEERFTVEHSHDDDSVWYEVYCFSRANHWLSKLTYPYLRIQQYRFRHLSARAMKREISALRELPRSVAG